MKKNRWEGTFQQKAEQRLEARSKNAFWRGKRQYFVTEPAEETMLTEIAVRHGRTNPWINLISTPSGNNSVFIDEFVAWRDRRKKQWLRPEAAMLLKLQGYQIEEVI